MLGSPHPVTLSPCHRVTVSPFHVQPRQRGRAGTESIDLQAVILEDRKQEIGRGDAFAFLFRADHVLAKIESAAGQHVVAHGV